MSGASSCFFMILKGDFIVFLLFLLGNSVQNIMAVIGSVSKKILLLNSFNLL